MLPIYETTQRSVTVVLSLVARVAELPDIMLDAALKGTLLMLLAAAAVGVLRCSSAAVRHRVWGLMFCGLLLLPVLSAGLPQWRVPILPPATPSTQAMSTAALSPAVAAVDASAPHSAPLSAPADAFSMPLSPDDLPLGETRRRRVELQSETLDAVAHESAEHTDRAAIDAASGSSEPGPTDQTGRFRWIGVALTVWATGTVLVVFPLAWSIGRNAWLHARSARLDDPQWRALLDELRESIRLRRRVDLLSAERPLVPMTWGLVRPVVLLPAQACKWTARLRRFVLLHELAHVKRWDVGFQMVARLACALYWFHPLAWYALRRLRIERELACDDCVLMAGERPTDYAQQLLAIARSCRATGLVAAVAMAGGNTLEHRIRAMLDRARSHVPLSPRFAALLLVTTAAIVTGVAVVRPAAQEPAADSPSQESAAEKPETSIGARDRDSAETAASDETTPLTGRVRDPDGQPVEAARVVVIRTFETNSWNTSHEVVLETRTMADGRFSIDLPATSDRFSDGANFLRQEMYLVALSEPYGPGWELIGARPLGEERTLELVPATSTIEGRIVDLEGRPVRGVRVRPETIWTAAEPLENWIRNARSNPTNVSDWDGRYSYTPQEREQIARFPTQHRLRIESLPLFPRATTDADGRFRLTGLGDGRLIRLRLDGNGIASTWLDVVTRPMEPVPMPNIEARYRTGITYGSRFDYTVEPDQPIAGKVRDADTGEPLEGVQIRLSTFAGSPMSAKGFVSAETDAAGRFELRGLGKANDADRPTRLDVLPAADLPYFRTTVEAYPQPGLDPVTLDIDLKRAIWLTGRITDSETGQPVRGMASYYPFLSNTHAADYHNFVSGRYSIGSDDQYATDDEGRFRIPALPGRGIVRVVAENPTDYRAGVGVDGIEDLLQPGGSRLNVYHLMTPRANSIAALNIPAALGQFERNIQVVPFRRARLRVVDPQGKPLDGVRAAGRFVQENEGLADFGFSYWDQLPHHGTNVIDIVGLDEDLARPIMLYHAERQLGSLLEFEEVTQNRAEPQTVTLQPCAIVNGRVVAGDGRQVEDDQAYVSAGIGEVTSISGFPGPTTSLRMEHSLVWVARLDANGRFEYVVPAGPDWKLMVKGFGDQTLIAENFAVRPGQRIDVGTIDIMADPAAWPKPQRRAAVASSVGREAFANASRGAAQEVRATTVTIRGQVQLPDGSPAAGVVVRAAPPMFAMLEPIVGEDFEPALSEDTTDAQGRFVVSFSSQPYGDLSWLDERWHDTWKQTTIAASLTGYGPQWIDYEEIEDPTQPIVLKLVNDHPIEGQVVDLEGRPIGGTEVSVGGPRAAADEDLSPWIEATRNGELPWTIGSFAPRQVEPRLIGLPESVTTDARGRFSIRGIGRERHVSLLFQSESVARREVTVATRRMEPIQRIISPPPFEGHETVYGAEFTFTAAPSRPIVGTVRDAATGAPMPGVAVESYKLADYPYSNHRVLKSVTDEQGRYRLTEMPKGGGNQLLVLPNDDQPYLMRRVDVPDPTGLGPVSVDIDIHRGIWITGRITDGVTGEPIPAARVYYLPFRSNEFAQALPEFDNNGNVDGDQMRYQTKADGTYRLVGLPGRAVVGASSIYKQYREGMGYGAIAGPHYRDTHYLDTYNNPVLPSPKWPHVMTEIDPSADAQSVTLDLQMDPGLSVGIRMVGPDEQPIVDVDVTGFTSSGLMKAVSSDRFEATQFAPDETRTILFHQTSKQLGWVSRISAQDAEDGPITVQLQPVATLTGRLLHQDGSPMTGAAIQAWPLPSGDFAKRLPAITTSSDGRFQLTLLPGAPYLLQAEGTGIQLAAVVIRMLTVEPGERKDLGDLALTDRTFVPATTENARKFMQLEGRIVTPDGKPHARASVWVGEPFAAAWTRIDRTRGDGTFSASIDRTRLDAAVEKEPETEVRIAATAAGYGLAWADFAPAELDGPITLNLLEDVPIEGRFVTMEGAPVAGVRVQVTRVPTGTGVDDFIKSAPGMSGVYFNAPPAVAGPEIQPVVTGADGRFRFEGLGAERIIRLEATGGEIGATRLAVATRPPPSDDERDGMIAVRHGLAESVYYARFTHIAAPARTLHGVITDSETGEAIEGVRVTTYGTWKSFQDPISTGPDGGYEITGVPKADDYRIIFEVTASRHFNKEVTVPDTQGLEPLEVSVALLRGIIARGRVTDARTGEPLGGTVTYCPLLGNENVLMLGEELSIAYPASSASIREDGSYELSVLPGPGAIAAAVDQDGYVSPTVDAGELKAMVGDQRWVRADEDGNVPFLPTAAGRQAGGLPVSLVHSHAVALLNPRDDAMDLSIDLSAVRGRSRTGSIVDDAGLPLTGTRVIGLGPSRVSVTREPLETAEFGVTGLAPGRKRTLLFVHSERELGARVVVTGDETTPLTVQTVPTGTLTGRFVDEFGDPTSDVGVELMTSGLQTQFWSAQSGPDGRFRLTGLVPDTEYSIYAKPTEAPGPSSALPGTVRTEPGETLDIGVYTQENEHRYRRVSEGSRDTRDGLEPLRQPR